ncbi:unnamed protein product [Bursaphelenchus okinawaensis]|uniref:protein O-GlcNAcase n=1 Tax=Bursaphelenchus okinawaensis TaxID=465554 RepID=A0A811KHF8_9BILA|nr:unnamed protein product [Bursaphelenchus okinawaensis]CAG9103250.1 unnamed protein product [Bursaphelenchus okinawaensis]
MEEFDDFVYYKKDMLGHGAFAAVYKGYQKSNKKEIAVKAIQKKNLNKAKGLLQKEIKILKELSSLKHENLVSLLKCLENTNSVFLVMEFCNGGDLSDYLQIHGVLDDVVIQHFFKQIARALEAINKKGIVHRDLKPQNILLCNPPHKKDFPIQEIVIKLADFGFARVLGEGIMAGTLCGSPMYMAPEVIMSQKYDAKADLWSIGTIMYQCRVGRAPFQAKTPQGLRSYYEKNRDLQPNIPSNCPDNLRDLLLRLLKRNSANRIEFLDFFNHRFFYEPVEDTSKRVLEQMSATNRVHASPGVYRRAPITEAPLKRIGSEQVTHTNHHNIPSSANLARPSTVARLQPATYASPMKRRTEQSPALSSPRTTVPRSLAANPELHRANEPPPRPPKTHSNQAMTDSGEFTFLPPLNQPPQRPLSRQGSASNRSLERQGSNHSQGQANSRAVPVPSQRLNFAMMEQERQKEIALKVQASANVATKPESQNGTTAAVNFDEMAPKIDEVNPPKTKYLIKELPKSRLPARSESRLRKPRTLVSPEEGPENAEPVKSLRSPSKSGIPRPDSMRSPSPTKPTVDNIRYLSTQNKPPTPVEAKKVECAPDVEPDEVDDMLNEFTGAVPFASGLSVESSDSQMVDSVSGDENQQPSTSGVYRLDKQFKDVEPEPLANGPSSSKLKDERKMYPEEVPTSSKDKMEPMLDAPPGLEDETLMDEEHKAVLTKLNFVLELTETLINVAEFNGSSISFNMESTKRKDPSSETLANRRSEQLVLYIKVMHIISSSLVMAQRHRDLDTLQPSTAVQHVLNQLNDKYHQCLTRSQELASLGISSSSDPSSTVVSAERLMYKHAIEMCQSAALDELYGNPHLCPSRYKQAYMMLHVLSEQVQSEQDRNVLSKYKDAVEKRLRILENQGYVISIQHLTIEWDDGSVQMEINHDQKCTSSSFICGAVEGFYGRPWTTEQRKDLFERFNLLGLNTYLYAPKDDLKHRFEWRSLYNKEETGLLSELIASANKNNVTFVYSLSPGIDIVYSDQTEVEAIQKKLCQVRDMGCSAFALLFDDIENCMNKKDAEVFDSFVMAQLTVTNLVYEYMGKPVFFFCPTEYCSSRCIPNLMSSGYLNTLGDKLHPEIHIMWTGPQVVSPELTVDHARDVTKVMKRKPLIWDNLHANDYDPKRVFLGPFKGRNVALKDEISGMLLNPNCKYEANFIPFYTLAMWNKSEADEEQETPVSNNNNVYKPHRALADALDRWRELYTKGPGPAIPPISHVECTIAPIMDPNAAAPSIVVPPPTIRTCEGNDLIPDTLDSPAPLYTSPVGNATTVTVQAFPINETVRGVTETHEVPLTVNSLCSEYSEMPLDASKVQSIEDLVGIVVEPEVPMEQDSSTESMTPAEIDSSQLALLVDLFYLPFDYGEKGVQLLADFQWMHKNAFNMDKIPKDKDLETEFNRRFKSFITFQKQLELLFRVFLEAPNRSLVQEIFPYLAEAHAITTVLGALLRWMKEGGLVVEPTNIESWWLNRRADVEPWSFGNGILVDLQKLIISSPALAELLVFKVAIPLPISSYSIKPIAYTELDIQKVFEYFSLESERQLLTTISPKACTDMFFDRTFAYHFKYGRPPHHFMVEDIEYLGKRSMFALLTTIISMPSTLRKIRDEFVGEYKEKYSDMLEDDKARELFEQDIKDWPLFQLPEEFLHEYPSYIEVRWREFIPESAWVRRLIHTAVAALAMNGSSGVFTILPSADEHLVQLYSRFGLEQINAIQIKDCVVMAHSLV